MARLDRWLDVGKTVARVAHDTDIKHLATSVAYHVFVSFIPFVVLAFAVLGRPLATDIADLPARFVMPGIQDLIDESVATASGRVWASVLSVGVLAWSGANITIDFLTGIKRVEGEADRPLTARLLGAAVVLGMITLAILSILVQSVVLAVMPVAPLRVLIGYIALFVVLTVIFIPLYYVPSREVTSLRTALPGALTTGLGWTVIHAIIQYYIANASQYAIYGVLSGVILILTSAYVAAAVLLTGVIVNAIVAGDGG